MTTPEPLHSLKAKESTIIIMCPGQGSQSLGMGQDLFSNFKIFKETLEEASDELSYSFASLCFENTEGNLGLTEFTQPALLCQTIATWRTLKSLAPITVSAVAGHSLGEYSALVLAEALDFATALKAVSFRGASMQEAVPKGIGSMAAVIGCPLDTLKTLCDAVSTPSNVVEIVNFNTPTQFILSGHKAAVELVSADIKSKKLGKSIALPVSGPFHSSLMTPAAKKMEEYLETVVLKALQIELYSTADLKKYKQNEFTIDLLVKQICRPVFWYQTLQLANNDLQNVVFLEVGAGMVLQGLGKKTLPESQFLGTQDMQALEKVTHWLEGK